MPLTLPERLSAIVRELRLAIAGAEATDDAEVALIEFIVAVNSAANELEREAEAQRQRSAT